MREAEKVEDGEEVGLRVLEGVKDKVFVCWRVREMDREREDVLVGVREPDLLGLRDTVGEGVKEAERTRE